MPGVAFLQMRDVVIAPKELCSPGPSLTAYSAKCSGSIPLPTLLTLKILLLKGLFPCSPSFIEFRMQVYNLQVCTHAGTEQIIDNPEKLKSRAALAMEFNILNVSKRARVPVTKEKKRGQETV
jgi:hypothetical protein